ncbi:RNA polymerase sigma factor [Rhodopseudomonas sp. RCAM05734]|uniref:RNA polymerase sigma factor n=1 Tax=Rhodopseudomonas sp. RCAM05734 TaxID=3457549 RepID=UPI004043FA17
MIKHAKFGAPAPGVETPGPSRDSSTLRELLVDRYGDLKKSLTRRLGSGDWADEALQDTFLTLDRENANETIRNPMAYLLRAAINTALNQRRAESRRLSDAEIDGILEIPDENPDSLRIIEGRSDIARFKAILMGLSPRAREILIAVRLDGRTQSEIAAHLGISLSLVEKELRSAHEYCLRRFKAGRAK